MPGTGCGPRHNVIDLELSFMKYEIDFIVTDKALLRLSLGQATLQLGPAVTVQGRERG